MGGWGGYLVCSDGYPQSYQYHNYSGSPEEGVRDMLRAGLDVDCAFGSGIALDAQTVSSALRMVRIFGWIRRLLQVLDNASLMVLLLVHEPLRVSLRRLMWTQRYSTSLRFG